MLLRISVQTMDFPMVDRDLRVMLKCTSQLLRSAPPTSEASAKPFTRDATASRVDTASQDLLGVDVC